MEKTTTLPVRPHSPSLSSRNDNLVTTFQGELWIWILETAFLLFRRESIRFDVVILINCLNTMYVFWAELAILINLLENLSKFFGGMFF